MLSSGAPGHVPVHCTGVEHESFGSAGHDASGPGRRRGAAADGGAGRRAALQAHARAGRRDHRGQPVRALPRRPSEDSGRAHRAGQGPVGRGRVGGPAGQELPQPMGRRVPAAAPGHQDGRPRLHRPVHADAPRHHGRADRQRDQGGDRVLHPSVRARSAAAGRRLRRRRVRQGRRGDHRRRQPVLLRPQGDQGRRARRRRRGARPRRARPTSRCPPTTATRTRRRSAR